MARSLPPHQPSFGARSAGDSDPEEDLADRPPRDGHNGADEDLVTDAPGDLPGNVAVRRGRVAESAWGPDAAPDGGEEHDGAADEPPVVRVNDDAKVSRVDTGQLEAAPAAGGRFSTWRARRRAARAEEAVETDADVDGDDASRVLQFPTNTHRRRRRRHVVALLTTVVVLALLALVVFFSPLFATRTIEVEGATLTDPGAVQEALSGFQGVPLTRVSKQDVEDSLGDVPQVKSVDVVLHPPHTIAVQLHERVGVAVVEDGDSLVLVDSEGKPLSTVPKSKRPDVPLVAGGRGVLSTQKFTDVSEVLAALPAEVLSRLESAAAPSGSAVELSFKDGRKVLWGDASQSELKAQVVAAFVNSEATADATEIDVSAPLHPVVR